MDLCDGMAIFGLVSFTLNCLLIIGYCAKKCKADKFDETCPVSETYQVSLFDESPVPF